MSYLTNIAYVGSLEHFLVLNVFSRHLLKWHFAILSTGKDISASGMHCLFFDTCQAWPCLRSCLTTRCLKARTAQQHNCVRKRRWCPGCVPSSCQTAIGFGKDMADIISLSIITERDNFDQWYFQNRTPRDCRPCQFTEYTLHWKQMGVPVLGLFRFLGGTWTGTSEIW